MPIKNELALEFAEKLKKHPEINNLPPEHQAAFKARAKWLFIANDHQLPPSGDWWDIWLLLAGRGAGKTRCAAEWTWYEAWSKPGTRWLVSAPTSADVRDTCFEGDSGLLNVMPAEIIADYIKSHNCFDPKFKRRIIPDAKLAKLLRVTDKDEVT